MTTSSGAARSGERPSGAAPPGAGGDDHATGRVAAFLADHGWAITAEEARRLGLTRNDIRGLVARDVLLRVARGAYVCAAFAARGATERHLASVRALLRQRPGALGASHVSAARVHGLPLLRQDLDRVHLAHRRPSKETRRRDVFTVHRCPGVDAFVTVDGLDVVVPALAVLGTTLSVGIRSGIMTADAALRRDLTTKDELAGWIDRMQRTPGLGAARHVVAKACPSAESPGESLTRLVLHELGYAVVPQFRIVEDGGFVVARVDFYLPDHGVVVEFDGKVKYEGLDGADALAAEKRREDRIRALGYGVARLTWADLFNPRRVRAAVEQAARSSSLRAAHR